MKKRISLLLVLLLVCSLVSPLVSLPAEALWEGAEQDWGDYLYGEKLPCKKVLDKLVSTIQYPEEDEYLEEYRISYVKAPKDQSVTAKTAPKFMGKKGIEILDGGPVLVLAEQGKYACVIDITQSAAGWIESKYLDDNYYGQLDPVCTDVRAELESWTDIDRIYSAYECIIGLKKDGSTVSVRYGAQGADISNWGKLKSIYADNLSRGCIYGITADKKLQIFANAPDGYPSDRETYSEAFHCKQTDCRLQSGVTSVLGNNEYGYAVLSNGRMNMMFSNSYILADGCGFDRACLYYDSALEAWCYLSCSWDRFKEEYTRTLFIQKEDGSFDWSSGKDVSGDEAYIFHRLFQDIVAVKGRYPNEAFTALREDGSLIFYGTNAFNSVGFLHESERFTLTDGSRLDQYRDIKCLINEEWYVNHSGEIVTSLDLENGRSSYSWDLYKTDFFRSWIDVESGFCNGPLFFAVTSSGQVLEDHVDHYLTKSDMGQFDVAGWKNVSSIISSSASIDGSADNKVYFTLGVTTDGKVLIAGVLPGEDPEPALRKYSASAETKAEKPAAAEESQSTKSPKLPPVFLFEDDGETFYYVDMNNCDNKICMQRMYTNPIMLDLLGNASPLCCFEFLTPIENCRAISVPVTIVTEEGYDNSNVSWSTYINVTFPGETTGRWVIAFDFTYVDGEEARAAAFFDKPVTINAIMVAPSKAPNGYGPFQIGCSFMKSILIFGEEEHSLDFYRTLTS